MLLRRAGQGSMCHFTRDFSRNGASRRMRRADSMPDLFCQDAAFKNAARYRATNCLDSTVGNRKKFEMSPTSGATGAFFIWSPLQRAPSLTSDSAIFTVKPNGLRKFALRSTSAHEPFDSTRLRALRSGDVSSGQSRPELRAARFELRAVSS